MQETQMAAVLFVLFVCLVFLLIGREITCWYFKINELSRKLDTTNKTLADIRDLLAPTAASVAPVPIMPPAPTVNGLKGLSSVAPTAIKAPARP
jgi:hypothetical protein